MKDNFIIVRVLREREWGGIMEGEGVEKKSLLRQYGGNVAHLRY